MTSGSGRGRTCMRVEITESMFEQRVGTLEIATQPSRGGGAVLARERLRACGAKEMPVHADQERSRDPCVARIDPLFLERTGERVREQRHDLELLRLQRLGLFEDTGEDREPGTRETRRLADLERAERGDDRLAVR